MTIHKFVVLEAGSAPVMYNGYGDSYTQRLSLMDRRNPAAEASYKAWMLAVKAAEQRRQERLQQWRANDLRNNNATLHPSLRKIKETDETHHG